MRTALARKSRADVAMLDVRLFEPMDDRARYERFNRVRGEVFGKALGWKLPPDVGPWHDVYDDGASCALAEAADGEPIGILRALQASCAFPHRELFDTHLARCGLQTRLDLIGTLNALAVLPQYRRRTYVARLSGAQGTASRLMLRACLEALTREGIRIVLATVMGAVSARAFLSAGFQFLDLPKDMPGQRGFVVANVAAVLPSPLPVTGDDMPRVRRYLDKCHRHVSAAGTVENLFGVTASCSAQGDVLQSERG